VRKADTVPRRVIEVAAFGPRSIAQLKQPFAIEVDGLPEFGRHGRTGRHRKEKHVHERHPDQPVNRATDPSGMGGTRTSNTATVNGLSMARMFQQCVIHDAWG